MRRSRTWLWLSAAALLLLGACRPAATEPAVDTQPEQPVAASQAQQHGEEVNIVVAPTLVGTVDVTLVRRAYSQAAAQAERDFSLRPTRPITIYIDPDSAIGLEDALGLSQKYAIHLRAGRTRNMAALLPLMMHEYTHTLQYQLGRLRPQWWVEGQADHQALRVRDATSAGRERRQLYSRLATDVRSGRAPQLASLRGGLSWDEYVKRAGAGKAYGWGNAAVAFIEDRAGYDGVVRVMKDSEGPNTLGRFDEAVREVTGLAPEEFDAALKRWVTEQAQT